MPLDCLTRHPLGVSSVLAISASTKILHLAAGHFSQRALALSIATIVVQTSHIHVIKIVIACYFALLSCR